MENDMKYKMVITTCENREEADSLAKLIIEKRLAACVQLSDITSYYHWDEKVNRDSEVKLTIKTTESTYSDLEYFIKANHSYDTPQIIMIPIENGSKEYLDWIDESIS